MTLLDEKHGEIGALLDAELAGIESRFAAELLSDLPCVNELAEHLEQYRGKMLRPMLLLVSGLAPHGDGLGGDAGEPVGGRLNDAHRTLATVVEMVHMATLVHDDVLDEQDVRRKAATINRLHGNETAVMLGDYLISHAYHLCASLDSQAAARLIGRTTNTVCEGELLQLANRNNWGLDEATYFEIIRRKTASLCGASCRLGAMLAGAPEPHCRKLDEYGVLLGQAFQIIDDVLDLTGDPGVVGKSLGKDLEKGKLTLPLIHRLGAADGPEREELLVRLESRDRDGYGEVARRVSASESVAYARRRAEELIDRARRIVGGLPASAARQMLLSMAEAVIHREL